MAIASVNPATGEKVREFPSLGAAELEKKIQQASDAFGKHRRTGFAERAQLMSAAAAVLEDDRDQFARTITLEMGKLLKAATDEVMKCANACRYYAENAERLLADEEVDTGASRSYLRYDPLGPVLAIMPWNFPFWQVFRFAAPALMAGNVGLLKHAANVPQCALAIEEVFRRAGFAPGTFQTLLIDTEQTASIIDDPRVKAVTLTGSDRAGSDVASRAARQIKKAVLELGGSDPFVVMPDADIEAAVDAGVKSRTINTGQSCIAAKRFIIVDEIFDDFITRFAQRMRCLKVGDPLDPATEIGPLATEAILDGVDEQVKRTVAAGATLLTGGRRVERPGFFYEPTVLADAPRDSAAGREEVFGPVASFFRVRDAAEAIAMANDSVFGLGASAWTTDPQMQDVFARELESGMVFINGIVASDPRLPFGGIKRSGFGRELGALGLHEFMNIKSVVVAR